MGRTSSALKPLSPPAEVDTQGMGGGLTRFRAGPKDGRGKVGPLPPERVGAGRGTLDRDYRGEVCEWVKDSGSGVAATGGRHSRLGNPPGPKRPGPGDGGPGVGSSSPV